MHKYIIAIGIIASLGFIWIQSGIFDALIRFVTIGLVPGTNISLSPLLMFGLMTLALWVGLVPIADSVMRTKSRR